MNSRWGAIMAAALVAFASVVMAWQLQHREQGLSEPYPEPYASLTRTFQRANFLAGVSNIVDRSGEYYLASATCRNLDLLLPADALVFLADLPGPTNAYKLPIYYYLTYHLFPRPLGTTLDGPPRVTKDGFAGRTSESDAEMYAHGYDVRLDYTPSFQLQERALGPLNLRSPDNPAWFGSGRDPVIAGLLPWLTALAGRWLFRRLFPRLAGQMPLLEQLAYGFGLGMLAVAALTLGIKLCGFHGQGLVLGGCGVLAVVELWSGRQSWVKPALGEKWFRQPLTMVLLVAGLAVFAILFRIAGLEGMVDPDAAMAWLLKAKIMHLTAGHELVHWFSAPGLALANLDYPTLVPALHAATYDSLGHVDEFVTKFWPVWMLFFLFAALAVPNRRTPGWRPVLLYTLLGLLLLPATQRYGQMEGGTVPMIFFTVLGFVQCASWLAGGDRARLGLGLTLLFGAAMTKFEGFIFLALAGGWLLLVPAARPAFKLSPAVWRLALFWFLAALPFVSLRLQIPAGYQSGWAGAALHNPGGLLANWPHFFLLQLAPLFLSQDLAAWSGDGGAFHWTGHWAGAAALFNQPTLGLAWLCVLLTLLLWFAQPARRRIILWVPVMLVAFVAALSVIFASLASRDGLGATVTLYGADLAAIRYLLPALLAWFAVLLTLIFAEPPAGASGLPALKAGRWLLAGALVIIIGGGLVLPKFAPAPAPAPAGSPDITSLTPRENLDMLRLTGEAIELERAGQFAGAIGKFREAARQYPNNPTALNNLAWSLVANPGEELRNGPEAVQFATRAADLTDWQQPDFIRTLAAAYAEAGQPAKAAEMAQQAHNTALLNRQPEVARKNDQLLKPWFPDRAGNSTNHP